MTSTDARLKGLSELTDRELEILQKVATGATNQQIAVAFDISINTVKAHLRNVYAKLGCESRTEATLCAIQQGLVQIEEPAASAAAEPPTLLRPPLESVQWSLAPMQVGVLVLVVLLLVSAILWPQQPQASAGAQSRLVDAAAASRAEVTFDTPSRWQSFAQMPSSRSRFAAASVDGQVLVVGGIGVDGPSAQVMAYDPTGDRWAYRADKPTAVANVGAAALAGLVYVPGGMTSDGSVLSTLEVYDPARDAWSQGPPLPMPVCAYALAVDEGAFYVVGGWDGRHYLDTVYRLDVADGTWQTLPPLSSARGFATAAMVQGELYVVGGYDGEQDLALNESRSLAAGEAGTWVPHAPLSVPRAGHGMVLSQGSLYVVGGGWESPFAYNERYDVANDAWSSFESPLTGEWRNLGLALAEARGGAFVLALGGWNGRYLGVVEGYQVFFPVYLSAIEKGL